MTSAVRAPINSTHAWNKKNDERNERTAGGRRKNDVTPARQARQKEGPIRIANTALGCGRSETTSRHREQEEIFILNSFFFKLFFSPLIVLRKFTVILTAHSVQVLFSTSARIQPAAKRQLPHLRFNPFGPSQCCDSFWRIPFLRLGGRNMTGLCFDGT